MRNVSGRSLSILLISCFFMGASVPGTALTWTPPQFIGNGAATAVSTNGNGSSAVIFRDTSGPIRAAVETNNVWGAPGHAGPIRPDWDHRGRAERRRAGGLGIPHHQHLQSE